MKNWLRKLLQRRYDITDLENTPGNEMWRLCWRGYHQGRWFARLDWGSRGWRLTQKAKPEHKMEAGPLPRAWRR